MIRNVVVPKLVVPKALLLTKPQFNQIRSKSEVMSDDAMRSEFEEARNSQDNELTAATQRKQRFQEMDLHR